MRKLCTAIKQSSAHTSPCNMSSLREGAGIGHRLGYTGFGSQQWQEIYFSSETPRKAVVPPPPTTLHPAIHWMPSALSRESKAARESGSALGVVQRLGMSGAFLLLLYTPSCPL